MRWQQPAWAYRCHRDLGQPRWWRIVGSGRFPRPNKPPRRRWKYDWITPAQPGGSRCWRATGEEQRAQPNGHNPNVGSYVIDHPASDRGLCSCALVRLSPVPAFRLPVNRSAFGPFSALHFPAIGRLRRVMSKSLSEPCEMATPNCVRHCADQMMVVS